MVIIVPGGRTAKFPAGQSDLRDVSFLKSTFWGRRCFLSEDHLKTAVLTVFAVRTILKSLSFVETKTGMEFTPSTSQGFGARKRARAMEQVELGPWSRDVFDSGR